MNNNTQQSTVTTQTGQAQDQDKVNTNKLLLFCYKVLKGKIVSILFY